MALKIVTGGTTGAADGTLVSSGNPLVIVALNTAVNAHIRCDDGYWSADQSFDVPAELEVSFDGGSTWYDNADEPITAPEIYAVNVPIKIRQTVAAGSTSGSFVTDGTYTAIAALSTPTLTATVVSPTQIDLSWTNVSNEDASPGYTIERSPDGSSWSALTTKAANVTTHSDTGLTASTHYYYRVKAEGSGRYSDSGWGTDDDTTSSPTTVSFFPSNDGGCRYYDGTGTWSSIRGAATGTNVYDTSGTTPADASSFVASYPSLPLITRGMLSFDTSSLPDGATIVSAKVKLWGNSVVGSEGTVILVNSTHSVPIVVGDFDLPGTTKLSDTEIALSAWASGAYNEFPLNAAGLAAISKTGTTKIAGRHSSDYNNSAPSTDCAAITRYSEYTGTSSDPVLEVVYY